MVTTATPNNKLVVGTYGESAEIFSLAKRIKVMVPGGSKLTDPEAQALAQVTLVTRLNPFIGEIWYIPGRGPMVGIKGARRCGNEHIESAGGKDAYWFPELIPCSAQEAGAPEGADVAAAYKCVITDSVSTKLYQKMLLETITMLRDASSPDPVGEARQIVGKKPEWIGYGYSTVSEQSKMNKQALAMKRAEADAIKRKFDIPFGAEVAAGDNAVETGDWIDARQEEVTDIPQEEEKPVQMYKYHDSRIVDTVARVTQFSKDEALHAIHQARDMGKIGATLSVEEAEEFAKNLINPK